MGKKHGANNLQDYRHIFEAALDRLAEGGFLFSVNLTFTPIPGAIEIRGTLECTGRIFIKVEKLLALYGGE